MIIHKPLYAVFAFFLFFLLPTTVFADHDEAHDASLSATPTKSIEYAMPYPGLLPDNPFYALKMVRDKFVSMLISDTLKKAEFDLLQADKRIQAGVYLINKDSKKANLALSTIAKGQQYFIKALADDVEAKKQGHNTKIFTAKLYLAAQKQREIISGIVKKVPKDQKGYYQKILSEQESLVKGAKLLSQKDQPKK